MKLESIHIFDQSYGREEGKLTGKLKIRGENGQIELTIGFEACQQVLAVIAEGMAEESRRVADLLTAEIIEHCGAPLLPDNSEVIEAASDDNPKTVTEGPDNLLPKLPDDDCPF